MESEEPLLVPESDEISPRDCGPTKCEEFVREMQKLSYIAMPMVVVTVSQYLLRAVSMMMLGHLGELALASATIAISIINATGFGLLTGMASALETLCGQAYGAKQYKKLGTFTNGSIIWLCLACLLVCVLWIYTDTLLILLGQDPVIAAEAGKFSIWMIPSLFPFAILQSLNRYLQTQSLIYPMLVRIYVKCSSACKKTRAPFSKDVLLTAGEFFKFAIPSAVMVFWTLEWWTFEIVILLSGLLPNPELETSVLSICLTFTSLHYLIPYSFGAAASTRVSNELGAGKPQAARLVLTVVVLLGAAEFVLASAVIFFCRNILGYSFSNEKRVIYYVKEMAPFLCASIVVDSLQAVLSGIVRGNGWQHIGAYINLGAYYLVGIPTSLCLGFILNLKGEGLWSGLVAGATVQSILLGVLTFRTDWDKQAIKARRRVFDEKTCTIHEELI
ncbi:hypothetical protein CASFOL_018225 [Castilleja foliolosa]|uniref:Protein DETOXIFICATION n=1 Tax=Castilleja foliolosa TaxID=1961234 RepID=A0ABD3D7V3_9LAMI